MRRSSKLGRLTLLGLVVSPTASPAQESPDPWTATELERAISGAPVATIGVLDGEGCQILGSVADALLDEQGRSIVLDGIAQSIGVFDSDGRCVFGFGNKGRGPGELEEAMRLLLAGDRLLVLDPGNGRIERYQLGSRSAQRLPSIRLALPATDLCGGDPLRVAAAHEGAVVHTLGGEGTLLQSFGRFDDGDDRVRLQISQPGRLLCDEGRGVFTVAGWQVADIHRYDADGVLLWKAEVPGFIEPELIMDGQRVRGFRPSSEGLNYVATLLQFAPGLALVQAGTPTDVGIRRTSSFVLDLGSGHLRRVDEEDHWPRVFDIRGDRVLADAGSAFPQLVVYHR